MIENIIFGSYVYILYIFAFIYITLSINKLVKIKFQLKTYLHKIYFINFIVFALLILFIITTTIFQFNKLYTPRNIFYETLFPIFILLQGLYLSYPAMLFHIIYQKWAYEKLT